VGHFTRLKSHLISKKYKQKVKQKKSFFKKANKAEEFFQKKQISKIGNKKKLIETKNE
jgi:hypothetical protein